MRDPNGEDGTVAEIAHLVEYSGNANVREPSQEQKEKRKEQSIVSPSRD